MLRHDKNKMLGKKRVNFNHNIVNISFNLGLIIKGIDAIFELVGGSLLMVVNHEWILKVIKVIAAPELGEDPTDAIMNYIIQFGNALSLSVQHSVAFYLLLHGVLKVVVIALLWSKLIRAYIPAACAFVAFILYEMYSFIHNPSIILGIFIIVDIAVTVLIVLEYKLSKEELKNKLT